MVRARLLIHHPHQKVGGSIDKPVQGSMLCAAPAPMIWHTIYVPPLSMDSETEDDPFEKREEKQPPRLQE
jgi:hypothetical protein